MKMADILNRTRVCRKFNRSGASPSLALLDFRWPFQKRRHETLFQDIYIQTLSETSSDDEKWKVEAGHFFAMIEMAPTE
jgi:hypothetical protein